MTRRLLPLLTAILLSAPPAAPTFAAQETAGAERHEISIELKSEPVEFDYSRSHNEIKSMAQCERPATSGKYLGLTRARVGTRLSSRVAAQRTAVGYTGSLISADVTVTMDDRMVYIASELPEGTCSFDQTMAHEMRHVSIDDMLAEQFKSRIREALDDAWPSVTGVKGRTPEDVRDTIQARMDSVLEKEMRALRVMRVDRHQAFDSSEEYARLGKICGGETRKFIMASEAGETGWHAPVDCPDS